MIWGELEKRDGFLQIKSVAFELLGIAQELNKTLNENKDLWAGRV